MILTVTGSNGNVGRRVVLAALKAGHTVRGVDNVRATPEPDFASNPSYTFHEADLRDYNVALDLLRGSDAVVQLAACPTPGDYVVVAHNT